MNNNVNKQLIVRILLVQIINLQKSFVIVRLINKNIYLYSVTNIGIKAFGQIDLFTGKIISSNIIFT